MSTVNYRRTQYGELLPKTEDYEIWQTAKKLIREAVKENQILESFDTIHFDRKRRASGSALHHEIYDILPDPLIVLLCVRETEGSKYGVGTKTKNYYYIKIVSGKVIATIAPKTLCARNAKAAQCELGCAIETIIKKEKV